MLTITALLLLVESDVANAGLSAGSILLFLVIFALAALFYWRVAAKAGYPGWYGLGAFVPLLNLLLMVLFAFSEWPIERELKLLRNISLTRVKSTAR